MYMKKITSNLEDVIPIFVTHFISQSIRIYVHISDVEVQAQSNWELMGLERESEREKDREKERGGEGFTFRQSKAEKI